MKTNRSLVVIVSLITATLLLTACAQPEQSSLAGDWLLTPKDKTRGLTGSIAVNIAPSRCKTNCRGDNLPDNTRRWQLSGGNEKVGLNPGWQCYTSFFMRVCQGKPGTRPIVNEDYVSESGFFGSMMHVGIIELRRCQSENCQQELKAINTH